MFFFSLFCQRHCVLGGWGDKKSQKNPLLSEWLSHLARCDSEDGRRMPHLDTGHIGRISFFLFFGVPGAPRIAAAELLRYSSQGWNKGPRPPEDRDGTLKEKGRANRHVKSSVERRGREKKSLDYMGENSQESRNIYGLLYRNPPPTSRLSSWIMTTKEEEWVIPRGALIEVRHYFSCAEVRMIRGKCHTFSDLCFVKVTQ